MKARLVIPLAVAGSALVGLVSSAAQAQFADAGLIDEFMVPPARLGDRVTFDSYERTPDHDWAPVPGRAFTINETVRSHPDEFGFLHDTVVLQWDRLPGLVVPKRTFLDLTTRHVLREEHRHPWGDGFREPSDLGPRMQPGWFKHRNISDLWLAGQTLRVGEDRSHEYRWLFEYGWGFKDAGDVWDLRPPEAELMSLSAKVVGPARIGGLMALGLQLEGQARFHVLWDYDYNPIGPVGALRPNGEIPFLSFQIPVVSNVTFSQTFWATPDVPYPILIEENVTVEQKGTREARSVLNSYAPGHRPIPWGQDGTVPHYEERSALERSGPQTHPADGTAEWIGYSLAQAKHNVEADATLAGFQLWRTVRPDHQLLGAHFAIQGGSIEWDLAYGTLSGDSFEVHSRKDTAAGAPTNAEDQPRTFEVWEEDLPKNPVTFAAAARIWEAAAEPDRLVRSPQWGDWGLGGPGQVVPGPWYLNIECCLGQWLEIGGGDPWTNNEPLGGLSPYGDQDYFWLVVNLTSGRIGNLEHLVTGRGTDGWEVADRGEAAASRPPDAKPIVPTRIPPGAAVAISGSVLAAFLGAYFLPLLKTYFAELLWVVPGYAKLRRSALLNNKTRDALLHGIKAEPGVTATELRRNVSAGWSTIIYHLRVLEKNGLISSLIDTRHKRFFPVGDIDHGARGRIAVLKNDNTKRLYQMIEQAPGVVQKELANQLGVSRPSTIWHLRRLEEVGLIAHDKRGHRVHYFTRASQATINDPAQP